MRTLIRDGTIVTAAGARAGHVLVEDERIAAVLPGSAAAAPPSALEPPPDRVIDATGQLVLPGGVDVHTHLDMPLGSIRTADDFASGTVAAACGGTTTIVDYITPERGESLRAARDTWMGRALGRAVVDFGFHMTLTDLRPEVEAEMGEVVREGIASFKVFMAYPGRLMLDDGQIYRAMRRAASLGALTCVHAENGPVIDVLVREALAAGRFEARWHARTRPAALEGEAAHRAVVLGELAGAALYLVHLSGHEALQEVIAARRRGLAVFGETCPQYLFLSEDDYDRPWPLGRGVVMSPPLRPLPHQEALWAGLSNGDVQAVATDHCPFLEAEKRQPGDFASTPNGAPGIESRLTLLYHGGVRQGRLSLERFVDVVSTTPARLFGLYPAKGTVEAGSDADLVIFDPEGRTTLSASSHHTRADYTPYEGRVLEGAVAMVLSRGEVVVEGNRYVGRQGRGRFLPRAAGGWRKAGTMA